MDAFTDDDGNWRMAPLLRQPRSGGADTGWRARQPQDPAVRQPLDVWSDPGATRAQREWAARVLLDAGVPGVWRGGLPAEAAETPRLLPAGEPASLAGQPERLLPNPAWREQRWQALREQYGIPESARMRSIYEIEPVKSIYVEGITSESMRVWLGTSGASGYFTPGGAKVPYVGGWRGSGGNAGTMMRGTTAGLPDYVELSLLWAQRKGVKYPPGIVLGGGIGEDLWRPLSKSWTLEQGLCKMID